MLDLAARVAYIPEFGKIGLNAYLGYKYDLSGSEQKIDFSVAGSGNSFSTDANGLVDSSFNYGIGGYYDIMENLRFSFNYHAEARLDAENIRAIDLRITYIL